MPDFFLICKGIWHTFLVLSRAVKIYIWRKEEMPVKEKINLNRVSEKPTIGDCFNKFIMTKRAMNLSDRTIIFYLDCFKYFTEFCKPETLAEDITKDTVIGYLVFLDETKAHLSDQTVSSYMRGTKPFLKFLIESGHTNDFVFPTVKATEPIKETYTDEELNKLLVKPDISKCS
jgi:integrase/recombinase XerD